MLCIGQCNYGFANACLDMLAEQRKKEGLPAFSIQFGVVDNVGVADKRMQVYHCSISKCRLWDFEHEFMRVYLPESLFSFAITISDLLYLGR